jgi:excisionase family DNA binding protein
MPSAGPTLTTQEAADLLGVARSTIKRWADQGLLRAVRTPGGHRRYLRDEVERLAAPAEPLALDGSPLDRWIELLASDVDLHLVVSAVLAERARLGGWCAVADLLGEVLTEVGERWAQGRLRILDEHRISHRLERTLTLCCGHLAVPEGGPAALLVTAEGDDHTLGLSLAELCVREAGWRPFWGGRGAPLAEVAAAVRSGEVALLGVSASLASSDRAQLRAYFDALAAVTRPARVALVLGGGGAWPDRPRHGHRLHDMRGFDALLRELRSSARPS